MAKCEFIDKDNFWIDLQVQTPISIAMERNTITEQEIVKPYFKKIQNIIVRQKQGGVTLADCLWEIEDYVNTLLSERGDKE